MPTRDETVEKKPAVAKTPKAPVANEFEEAVKVDAGTPQPQVVKKTALLKNVEDFLKDLGIAEENTISLEEKTIQTSTGKSQYVVLALAGGEESVKSFLLAAALATKVGYEKIGFELLDDTEEGEAEKEYVIVFHAEAAAS